MEMNYEYSKNMLHYCIERNIHFYTPLQLQPMTATIPLTNLRAAGYNGEFKCVAQCVELYLTEINNRD